MNTNLWNNKELHNTPEQLNRQKSAMKISSKKIQLNLESKTALISGSGKIPYKTTLENCTCVDFATRKLPCKHIYRLAHETGIFNIQNSNTEEIYCSPLGSLVLFSSDEMYDEYVNNETGEITQFYNIQSILHNIENCSIEELEYFLQIISPFAYRNSISYATFDSDLSQKLVNYGFFAIHPGTIKEKLQLLGRENILKLIDLLPQDKTQNINKRSITKTLIKILTKDLLVECEALNSSIFVLIPTPTMDKKYKSLYLKMMHRFNLSSQSYTYLQL